MTMMSSNRSSKLVGLFLVAVLVVGAVAGTATAIDVEEDDVPEEAEVGEKITVSFTLTELYQEPQYAEWSVGGETELENAVWNVEHKNDMGNTVNVTQLDGQEITAGPFQADGQVNELQVEVTGTVPEPGKFTYPENETFVVAEITQQRQGGTSNDVGTWSAHAYTAESKEARNKIREAEGAIESAEDAGASPSNAAEKLSTAKDFYEIGEFGQAINSAEGAIEDAESAESKAESAQQRNTLLLYGGIAIVVILIIAGGIYWYRQQQEDYSRM
jgi:ribosomal protein S16